MNPSRDIHSLAASELKAQDAESCQKSLVQADESRAIDGIRCGLEDMMAGRTAILEEFKKHVRDKHGISI